MRRYGLRDDQWDRIKDFLPGREGHVGGTAADNRLFVEAVLYRFRAGVPWRDLPIAETLWKIPPRDAGSKSIQNRFNEQSVVGRRAPHMAFAAGKKILDPIPLVVAQGITSHRSAPSKADHL